MPAASRADLRALAAFYLTYFTTIGVTLPTLSPFLASRGLSPVGLSTLLAVGPLLTTVLPPLWGYLADRTGRGPWILRAAAVGAAFAYALIALAGAGAGTIGAVLLLSFVQTPVVAVADGLTASHSVRAGVAFSSTRLWGSLGFVVGALLSALLLRAGALPASTAWPLWLAAGAAALGAAFALRVQGLGAEAGAARRPPSVRDASALLHRRPLPWLLLAAGLHWSALAPYHAFLSVRLADLQHAPSFSAVAMALAVTCEVAVFFAYTRLFGRVSTPVKVVMLACGVSAVRWALTAWCTGPWALVAVQAIHGLTFGAWYAANNALLARVVPDALRSTGQALFVASAFGAGGVGGFLLAGRVYGAAGSAACFVVAAVLDACALAALLPAREAATAVPDGGSAVTAPPPA